MPKERIYSDAVLLRMTAGTLDNLRKASGQKGQTVSEYLRQLIRKALSGQR
jgi:hypothetical protein